MEEISRKRKYIIRALLEGEVEVAEQPEEPIDYNKDPLENVTWTDNYSYNANTGALVTSTNEHCTDKFTAQSCMYMLSKTAGNYLAIFAWDANDNYLGRVQAEGLYMLKKENKYALKIYNTGTFDPSDVTLMPQDNSATAVPEFVIDLNANQASITASGDHFELNVSSIMSAAGVTAGNKYTVLNMCNHMGCFNFGNKLMFWYASPIAFCFYNVNTLQFRIPGVTISAEAIAAYLADNELKIVFNEGVE